MAVEPIGEECVDEKGAVPGHHFNAGGNRSVDRKEIRCIGAGWRTNNQNRLRNRKENTMPIINAQGKLFRSWESQLNACVAQAARLPNIEPLKNALQDILNQVRLVKSQQENN